MSVLTVKQDAGSRVPERAAMPGNGSATSDWKGFLEVNLPVVQHVIRRVCQRARVSPDQRAELTSIVLLKLMENDCAMLRAFRARSTLQTYLYAVVRRALLDLRIKEWGKWRPSRAAVRLGPPAMLLECLVTRNGVPAAEAVAMVAQHPQWQLSTADVWRLHEALPQRLPRPTRVDLDSAAHAHHQFAADHGCHLRQLQQDSARVRSALTEVLASLSNDERRLLRWRFRDGVAVTTIAARTGEEPAKMYRQFDGLLRTIRRRLHDRALTSAIVRPLLGHPEAAVDAVLTRAAESGSFD